MCLKSEFISKIFTNGLLNQLKASSEESNKTTILVSFSSILFPIKGGAVKIQAFELMNISSLR